MKLNGILFDKDGTLIDFDDTWGPAAYEVMRELSGGDEAKLRTLVEISHYVEAERRFLPSSPLVAGSSAHYGPLWAAALGRPATPDLYSEMDDRFATWGLKTLAPVHDPAEVCTALRARGLKLGIATNDAERSARMQAEALGLAPLLEYVAGYDSGFGPKPGPGMVTGFAEHIGCRPEEVALIGDSLHDLHAARAAGALAVAVLTGPLGAAARADLEPHADHVVGSIADLPALIDRLS
ncbi:MAG: HAD family hydrolase [Pseudomonadota bacterium]|nr:HAD family hydrolase [Pseudomonadota bacterium]